MVRVVLVVAFLAALAVPTAAAGAVPAACLPVGFPSTPAPPVFTVEVADFADRIHLAVWRQACQDGSGQVVVLVHATPVSTGPSLCGTQLTVVQNGVQITGRLRTTTRRAVPIFCDDLFAPTTLVLDETIGQPPFDEEAAFTLVWNGFPTRQIEIPPGPAASAPPSVAVIVTGCSPCRAGDLAEIRLHLLNPGPERVVEVKAGSRFPDGVSSVVFLGRYVEHRVPPGESDILVPAIVLPADLPLGPYVVEASLLDPDFGSILSRSIVTVEFRP